MLILFSSVTLQSVRDFVDLVEAENKIRHLDLNENEVGVFERATVKQVKYRAHYLKSRNKGQNMKQTLKVYARINETTQIIFAYGCV